MKKVRLIPLILSLFLPLAGCSFEDLMFWKKKNNDTPSEVDKTVTGIVAVHAPGTIEQNATLSDVDLDVSYSDSSTGSVKAERIQLDTSSLGTKTGTAFYGQFFKDFTIEVVEQGGGGGGESKTMDELTKGIVEGHNYKIEIESYYQEHPEEHFETFLSNINDEVYYGLDPYYPNLWESGYIKVKDQGIASFKKGLNSDEIVIQQFVSTNSSLGMHDVFGEMMEVIFEAGLVSVEEDHWKVTNQDIVGMFGTFSGIEDMRLFSNPAQIDIEKKDSTLEVTGIYSLTYIDEETAEPVTDHLYVGVTIKDIGSTSNALYEAFTKAESSKLPNPNSWDEDATEDFGDYYNNYVPPFIQGATYALHQSTKWNGLRQKYEIMVEDLACGDLTSSYVSQLSAQGYELLGDGIYTRRVENNDHTLADVYRAEINYRAPSEEYGGKTIGYFYPNGVFQVTYIMYTELISLVENVGLLNTYLGTTAASEILPRFSTDFAENQVAGFEDRTAISNQNVTGSDYGYIFTSGPSTYFRIYIPTYEDAVSFEEELVTASAAKGFTNVSHGIAVLPMMSMTDEATSYITITDLSLFSKSEYESTGYLQCRIVVYDNYNVKHTVDYDTSDPGVSSIVRIDPTGYYVEPGTTVTFKVNVVEGYEIDSISSNAGVQFTVVASTESYTTYSFTMPSQDITVGASTRSKAAGEGLVYDYEYTTFVYVSNNVAYESESMPADTPYSKLILVFKSDGTGTYTRIKYGRNSTTPQEAGTYTVPFSYTLVNGNFVIVATKDSSDNAMFDKWRMWTNSNVDNDNDLGSFNSDTSTITIGVYDSSNNTREIHLK